MGVIRLEATAQSQSPTPQHSTSVMTLTVFSLNVILSSVLAFLFLLFVVVRCSASPSVLPIVLPPRGSDRGTAASLCGTVWHPRGPRPGRLRPIVYRTVSTVNPNQMSQCHTDTPTGGRRYNTIRHTIATSAVRFDQLNSKVSQPVAPSRVASILTWVRTG